MLNADDQLKFLLSMLPGTALLFTLPLMHPIAVIALGFLTSYPTALLFDYIKKQFMTKRQEDNYTLRCLKCETQTLIVSFPENAKLQGLRCLHPCGGRLQVMKFYMEINGEYHYKNYKGLIYRLDERGNFHSIQVSNFSLNTVSEGQKSSPQ